MNDTDQPGQSAVGAIVTGGKVPWPQPTTALATVVSVGSTGEAAPESVVVKETWRDWMPEGAPEPDRLLTRDELVDRLRYYHIEADTTDIRFWEQRGILPRPIRQRRDGATRTTYPEWVISLVQRIRHLQAEGFSLEQIRPRVRRSAELLLLGKAEDGELEAGVVRKSTGPFWKYAVGAEGIDFPSDLGANLVEAARRVEFVTGVPSRHVNVVIVSEDGGETRLTVAVPSD